MLPNICCNFARMSPSTLLIGGKGYGSGNAASHSCGTSHGLRSAVHTKSRAPDVGE